ncbi:Hsp20/alpha crystallin family protein, partial [Ostertagia ostertagi]
IDPQGELFQVTDEESKLSFLVNVSEFKPDELTVNIDGRTLTVEGKQEITEGSNYTSRSLLQRWTLPEDVDVDQIRSTLTENGQLSIEVPKPKPLSLPEPSRSGRLPIGRKVRPIAALLS